MVVNLLALRRGAAQVEDLRCTLGGLEAVAERDDSPGTELPVELAHELRVVGLTCEWEPGATPALVDVDLRVARGELVGIAGPTGAGKSTLLDVLLGLLPPRRGEVLVDGRSIHAAPRAWRRRVGYVAQEPALFDDTVTRNVAWGRGDEAIDGERVRVALAAARLDRVVATLPRGTETRLGEAGARLSGGERQRLALARALYDAPQLLLLDEPTSALDPATEAELVATLLALRGSHTVVVVSHRQGVLRACDRVVLLQAGRVAACGAPGAVLGPGAAAGVALGESE
jgi:ATP-binding cassette subfamily C protein